MIESLDLGGAEKSLVTLLQNLDYAKYKVSLLLIKKEGVFNKFVPKEVEIIHHKIFGKSDLKHFALSDCFQYNPKLHTLPA